MGGSAREWSAPLRRGFPSQGEIDLRLVMTKFAPPDVQIAYEVRLEQG